MGETLTVSAIRKRSVSEVAQGICSLVARSDHRAEVLVGGENDPERDALVSPNSEGWTIVAWPNGHVFDPAFYRDLSKELDCLIATASIYDGDGWTHLLDEAGRSLDRFASHPDEHGTSLDDTPEDQERLRREWRGNAEVIGARLDVSPEVVRPYFVQKELPPSNRPGGGIQAALRWVGLSKQQNRPVRAKAYPDDEHFLDDCWVFVDFWRRLGIPNPYAPEDTSSGTWVRFPEELLIGALVAELANR